MNNYVIFRAAGKQYKVSTGDTLDIDKILGEKGQEVVFEEVLLSSKDDDVVVGMPTVPGVKVKAKIVDQIKGEKVRVAKFKAKARFRRVTGFRSQLTKIQIESITEGSKSK